ncbi:type I polyketide synthase [Streptomyces sp. NPDC015350]|uniref:type I polyketide synthase n=1 Tax=Streptomyces sp. NPDC015350 TaxID=3364955 RepID=UPI0036FC4BC6
MTRIPAHEHPDSIAITGMAAKLPGARDVTEFWRNLREGVESMARHSREEMLANGARPEQLDDPHYVDVSAPLDDADCFDAAFFGYSAREASIMEPQHRVFLECAYHALEDAAYDSRRHRGLVGVYGGSTMNTYILHNVMPHADDVVALVGDLQTMLGNDKDYLTTRVSHKLDLRGPSVAVQTACSTSLVAVHMACRALLDEECDTALAGGASIRMPHAAGYLANPGGTSSPDGHCRTFDEDAGGSVVGSGAGVVVLRRLADALRDGDRIHAVVRGSAINNDGQAKASFTAPSIDGQSRAVQRALQRAGVTAEEISLVEAHGTGTPLGDPIEVAALTRAFRSSTDARDYCWIGSAKPNIGHLDAAAGVAGLIKTVLSLKHRRVPPLVNFRRPNPKLELATSPFRVATELTALESDQPLLASVNSLAMGGTNAHVVLEEAPAGRTGGPTGRRRHPVLLSAAAPESLEELSQNLGQWAREHPEVPVADLAFTLATGRRDLGLRRALHARDLEDVAFGLSARGSRRQRESRARGTVRTAFLFPGQGAQRPGMGARLAAGDPVLAGHLEAALAALDPWTGPELREALHADPDDAAARAVLARTELTQPALFAVEWAMGRTLLDYGIRPYAMLGHSVGELVATSLGGGMDLATAAELVARRGSLMAAAPEGAMLYVNLSEREAEDLLGDGLSVAAVNAGQLVVVSGTPQAVDDLAGRLRADGVPHGRLDVTRAFHSPLMDGAAADFAKAVGAHELSGTTVPVVSDVDGAYLTEERATSPDYWAQQLRQPVRFADGLDTLARDGVTVFIEVGPGRSLSKLAQAATDDTVCLATMADGSGDEPQDLLDVLTDHWLEGGEVDWATYYRGEQRVPVSTPGYPFARVRHGLAPGAHTARPRPAAAAEPVARAAPAGAAPAAARTERGTTPMQRYVAGLWAQLLGDDGFGLHDSFFEIGGHSLLAMQMVTQMRKDGIEELEMTALFERPTVADLAAQLEALGARPPEGTGPTTRTTDSGTGTADAGTPPPGVTGAEADEALLAEVAALTDEEVRARLAELEGEERP